MRTVNFAESKKFRKIEDDEMRERRQRDALMNEKK